MRRERIAAVLAVIATVGCRDGGSAKAKADASASASASASARSRPETGTEAVLEKAGVLGIGWAAVRRDGGGEIGGDGVADARARTRVTGDTVFQAASIAKTVIATCVMQLVEAGRVDLDRDVSGYVGFAVRHPKHRGAITLRLLLSHRAAIADRHGELTASAEAAPLGDFLRRYLVDGSAPRADAFREKPPGTEVAYSNVGAALAAFVVERVAGESFAEVSAKKVFVPLGMRSTGWRAGRDPGEHPAVVVATPHALRRDPECTGAGSSKVGCFVPLPQASHAIYPVVDLRTSARDLERFARAMLRGGELDGSRILSASSVSEMMKPLAEDGTGEQALGWQIRTIDGRRVAGHEGEDAGASAAMFLDGASGTAAVVLANGDALASGDPGRSGAIEALLGDLLATARRPSAAPVAPVSSADAH